MYPCASASQPNHHTMTTINILPYKQCALIDILDIRNATNILSTSSYIPLIRVQFFQCIFVIR